MCWNLTETNLLAVQKEETAQLEIVEESLREAEVPCDCRCVQCEVASLRDGHSEDFVKTGESSPERTPGFMEGWTRNRFFTFFMWMRSHPGLYLQKFRAVWTCLCPSLAPPSSGGPSSWRRRFRMRRRRCRMLRFPSSSLSWFSPPSVSEHSCTARCSSTCHKENPQKSVAVEFLRAHFSDRIYLHCARSPIVIQYLSDQLLPGCHLTETRLKNLKSLEK